MRSTSSRMPEFSFIVSMGLRLVIGFIIFSILLFLPAGTFDWPEAWAFLIILLIYAIALHFLIFKENATTLKSRQHYKPVFSIDTFILGLAGIFFVSMFIFMGLDVGQFQWTSPLVPALFKYLGFSTLVCSLIVFLLVLKENAYLSRVIEVQEKQTLISTGPYAYVRHPMYLGNVLFVLSLPLALGSYVALVPAVLFLVCFIPRILFEERILIKKLEGYQAYMQQVRYRVIPKIW
ncbi:MAG: methyltransferase family protein [Candidatus Thorarchaeota archaeon]